MTRMFLSAVIIIFILFSAASAYADSSSEEPGDIWAYNDPNEFIIAVVTRLQQKTQYGQDLSVLSPAERIVYITQILEMEVNNGGFDQYFFHSSGDCSSEAVSAFQAIGANTTAEICRKAVSAFGRDIPVDWFERQEMMSESDSEEIAEILHECDMAFYDYQDDLLGLTYRYILENREQFN